MLTRMSPNTPALIFDLDGTLVDTAPDILAAANVALAEAGRPALDLATVRHMVGFGARSLVQQALTATGAPPGEAELERILGVFVVHYQANIAVASAPFPGVPETLERLAGRGVRMAVLTNKRQEFTDLLLPQLKLDTYFSAVFGGGRRPYSKPDPRVFEDVVAAAGGKGAGAIMIGDSITDVKTARAARAPVILVSYGYTLEPAAGLGADAVVDSFADIPDAAVQLLAQR